MRTIIQDLSFGLRLLRGNPGFTLVAVLTLALGISVNTTVFGWIDTLLLNPLPGVKDGNEIVFLEAVTSGGEYLSFSYTDTKDYRDNLRTVSGVAFARHTPLSIGAAGETSRGWAELVPGNFFDVLGIKPVLGRTFLPEESGDQAGSGPVAVISHRMWRSRFQQDARILGQTIRINRHQITIIGIAPPGFMGTMAGLGYDVWMPINMAPAMGTGASTLTYRGTRDLTSVFARLKPGVTVEQVRAEAAAQASRLAAEYPRTNRSISATAVPIWNSHSGAQVLLRRPLAILMAVSVLFLMIVCANIANLLLARAVSRQRELGLRMALGAGRGRLARQLFTETLLLALAGAVPGIILAMWMAPSLLLLLPPIETPATLSAEITFSSLGFSLLIALLATLIAGAAPVVLSARSDLNEAIKEGGRGGGSGKHSHRLRGILVVSEVALAAVALIGAGLSIRNFRKAVAIHPGFEMEGITVSQFFLSNSGYTAQEQRQFCRELRERMEAVPGVTGVSYSDFVPLMYFSSPYDQLEVEGYAPAPKEVMNIHRSLVPPGHFALLGIPVLEGRDFTELDDEKGTQVLIVNQTFAKRFFGGGPAIGRKVRVGNRWMTVAGIVKDTKYFGPAEPPQPHFYMPFRQVFAPGLNFNFFVKAAGDPARVIEVMRREALALNQDAVFRPLPFKEAALLSLYPQKVAATLLTVLGGISIVLAAIGIYSVMSYAVSQRTHEFGIRLALGARPGDVFRLVLRQGLGLSLTGVVVGILTAIPLARMGSVSLGGASDANPATFAATAGFLIAVTMLACWVPAWRATRVAPMVALRCE
jgi:predicted permease